MALIELETVPVNFKLNLSAEAMAAHAISDA
jgi:hypothetical protein